MRSKFFRILENGKSYNHETSVELRKMQPQNGKKVCVIFICLSLEMVAA